MDMMKVCFHYVMINALKHLKQAVFLLGLFFEK